MAKNTNKAPLKWQVWADNNGLSSNYINLGIEFIQEASGSLVDDSEASGSTVYSSAKIYSLLPEKTETGSVVTFSDGIPELPIVSGTFNIDANLDGVTEVTISNDTEELTVTLSATCYGGTVQTDGTVVNNAYYHLVTSSDFFSGFVDHTTYCTCYINLSSSNIPISINDGFALSNNFSTSIPSGNPGRMVNAGSIIYFAIDSTELSSLDIDGAKAWFNDNPTTIVYELATPEAGTSIDPFTINTLPGEATTNSISCDTGDSSVTYKTYIT